MVRAVLVLMGEALAVAGAEAYRRDAPKAEVQLFEGWPARGTCRGRGDLIRKLRGAQHTSVAWYTREEFKNEFKRSSKDARGRFGTLGDGV
jgi:hypothetical protein